jgi:hypothetical protein
LLKVALIIINQTKLILNNTSTLEKTEGAIKNGQSRHKFKFHCIAVSRWFSPGILVSSTYKTDRHNITEVLLKVVLNTIILTLLVRSPLLQ